MISLAAVHFVQDTLHTSRAVYLPPPPQSKSANFATEAAVHIIKMANKSWLVGAAFLCSKAG